MYAMQSHAKMKEEEEGEGGEMRPFGQQLQDVNTVRVVPQSVRDKSNTGRTTVAK